MVHRGDRQNEPINSEVSNKGTWGISVEIVVLSKPYNKIELIRLLLLGIEDTSGTWSLKNRRYLIGQVSVCSSVDYEVTNVQVTRKVT